MDVRSWLQATNPMLRVYINNAINNNDSDLSPGEDDDQLPYSLNISRMKILLISWTFEKPQNFILEIFVLHCNSILYFCYPRKFYSASCKIHKSAKKFYPQNI